MASGGQTEKLTANGKERAIITQVARRSDLGWESRGWKFTQDELSNPPSLRDNITLSEEKEYRRKAHTFIWDCCQLLRSPALVIAAALTICQRYFCQVSFRKIDRSDSAAAAIFLAAKVEEFRVHIKDVMIATYKVRHKRSERRLVENSDEYHRYKERLLKAENQLVNAMGFDFMIEHPFGHAIDLVSYLAEEGWVPADKLALISKGSNHLLIKSLRGTMCLEQPPSYRARLVTYLSLLANNISPPPGGWAEMMEFEDHRLLNRVACELLETLDDDQGKTGKKITKKRVAAALVKAGHIKTDRVPPQPTILTYADRDRMAARSPYGQSPKPHDLKPGVIGGNLPDSNGHDVATLTGSSSHGRYSSPGQRPRPPNGPAPALAVPQAETGKRRRTEDSTSNSSVSRPRPPPPPPRTPKPPGTPKPASTPKPPSTPKPAGTPKPPSTPKPQAPSASKPRPPSNNGQPLSGSSKPRPPSTPKPRPPSTPKPPSTNGQPHNNSSKPRPRPPPPRTPTAPSPAFARESSVKSQPVTSLSSPIPCHPSEHHPSNSNGKAATPPQKIGETRLLPRDEPISIASSSSKSGSGGGMPGGKVGISSTPEISAAVEVGIGKRSRDEATEDDSSVEPGSPGKKARKDGGGGAPGGKVGISRTPGISAAVEVGIGKRSCDEATEDDSSVKPGSPGKAPGGKVGISRTPGISVAVEVGNGKRSRDEATEDDSSVEPGSPSKRSRMGGDGQEAGSDGALTVGSSAVIDSIESGEIEDGEIPIRAVPVLGA